ncbi:MAG TPA: hypothetical protein VMB74_14415 [Streptosporangiaceae bacterium]|nr:hypothetical protein [Streptosporangiaceae bacterium]
MATSEQPDSSIRRARIRLRRRRWMRTAGICVLAASAALAVAPASALAGPAGSPGVIPREFTATQMYAKFGWLPAGSYLVSGGTTQLAQYLTSGGPRGGRWNLTVEARGACHVTRTGYALLCSPYNVKNPLTVRGPDVNGHRAFWLQNRAELAWEYGTKAWAFLSYSNPRPLHGALAETGLRVAKAVEFGQHVPIEFASRLTSGARHWEVLSTSFQREQGVYLAGGYLIAKATLSQAAKNEASVGTGLVNMPEITTIPQTSAEYCNIPKSWPKRHVTIHGYKLTLALLTKHRLHNGYSLPGRVLCGRNEDGLFVNIIEYGAHEPLTPTGVMYRTELLGVRKADWVKNPLR